MRSPSVKSLLATFRDLTPAQASNIKRLAREVDDPEKLRETIETCCPDTERYVRQM